MSDFDFATRRMEPTDDNYCCFGPLVNGACYDLKSNNFVGYITPAPGGAATPPTWHRCSSGMKSSAELWHASIERCPNRTRRRRDGASTPSFSTDDVGDDVSPTCAQKQTLLSDTSPRFLSYFLQPRVIQNFRERFAPNSLRVKVSNAQGSDSRTEFGYGAFVDCGSSRRYLRFDVVPQQRALTAPPRPVEHDGDRHADRWVSCRERGNPIFAFVVFDDVSSSKREQL